MAIMAGWTDPLPHPPAGQEPRPRLDDLTEGYGAS